ncbi:AraC family transcriptional regulator [Aquimarina spongiae]|uniref:Transcriptional regulator, AraC family n=1 Tax=Aquimarina spongiae TaxID=570521 RepID=A0A1M6GK00_9FLAO|nr:AraC family transcriptional regulator [Aquimarina spongiae]SHJ10253.1 transcriptional regulator, AraC family [Aquimarina spongiae]
MNLENITQIERYKKLIRFIDENFKDEINIEKIEQISLYSYRNINRIFQSLHQETIGKYIKRIRLEKSAEYLKYTEEQVSDIAINVGFSDVASFSKAFKSKFNCSPILFRKSTNNILQPNKQNSDEHKLKPLPFTIETLPEFDVLYVEHKGNTQDLKAIEKTWNTFIKYCTKNQLLSDESIFFSEAIDDNEITDDFRCRTNVALILREPLNFAIENLYQTKKHHIQKYAKFIHKGANEQLVSTYNQIYGNWLTDIQLEFADKPILEFYVNHHEKIDKKDLITEIYIPVM